MQSRPAFRCLILVLLTSVTTLAVRAQTAAPDAKSGELTVDRIYGSPSLNGRPTRGMAWSPDGKRLTFLDSEGTGKEAEQGDWVTVNYKGWIKDPKEPFDSTEGKRPFTAQLVPGGLIQGWIEGVPGMKEGGKRKLIIPYQLAYGERGMPPGIPPKSDLTFEIELVKVTR